MNATLPSPPRRRNEITHARHRRETWLQVYLPFALAALAFVAATVIVIVGSFGGSLDNSVMADTAAAWLSIPVLFVGLVALALVGGLIYGVGWLVGFLPPYFKQGQDFSRTVLERSRGMAGGVSGPIIAASARAAALRALWERLRAGRRVT